MDPEISYRLWYAVIGHPAWGREVRLARFWQEVAIAALLTKLHG